MFKLLILISFCSVVIAAGFWAPDDEYQGIESVSNQVSSDDYGYPATYRSEEPGDHESPTAYERETGSVKNWAPESKDFENPGVYNSNEQTSSCEDLQNVKDVPGDNGYQEVHSGREHARSFLNEWTVEVDGTEEVAQLVALQLGYVYGGPVSNFHTIKTEF